MPRTKMAARVSEFSTKVHESGILWMIVQTDLARLMDIPLNRRTFVFFADYSSGILSAVLSARIKMNANQRSPVNGSVFTPGNPVYKANRKRDRECWPYINIINFMPPGQAFLLTIIKSMVLLVYPIKLCAHWIFGRKRLFPLLRKDFLSSLSIFFR